MSNLARTTRIILTEEASTSLSGMLQKLKQEAPHLSVNHSALASFLIMKFADRGYFEKSLKEIEQKFFNEKKFLRKVLSEGSDLEIALKRIEAHKKARQAKSRICSAE